MCLYQCDFGVRGPIEQGSVLLAMKLDYCIPSWNKQLGNPSATRYFNVNPLKPGLGHPTKAPGYPLVPYRSACILGRYSYLSGLFKDLSTPRIRMLTIHSSVVFYCDP